MPPKDDAIIGISDHGGWAIFVTVAAGGTLLDRRRVDLVDEFLPKIPHHSECQSLPIDEAVALVERVRASALHHATLACNAVDCDLPGRVRGIALRHCPDLPPTIAECIHNYRAQNLADWVMYRRALAAAAEARSWTVHWYDAKAAALDHHLRQSIGPPWTKDHKLAMGAALAAVSSR